MDAVCDGDARQAIVQLDRLIIAGEHPLALFGAFSWTLRRYVAATRDVEQQQALGQRVSLSQALVDAGFRVVAFDNRGASRLDCCSQLFALAVADDCPIASFTTTR